MKLNYGSKLVITYGIIPLFCAVILLVVFEIMLSLFWPQIAETTFKNDESLAMETPLIGYVYRPDARATVKTPEFTVEYTINGEGSRDRAEHPDPKPPDVTRILLLGDSFTFGEGNCYEDIWPVIFEQLLIEKGYRVDVVKAGVQGYDTRTEALYLERLFPLYEPDIVILAFLPNDLHTNTSIDPDGEDTGSAGSHSGQHKQNTLHSMILCKRLLLSNDFLYSSLYIKTSRKEYFTSPPGCRLKEQADITRDLLMRAGSYCSEHGCKLAILSIPQQFQIFVEANDFEFDGIDAGIIDQIFAEFAEEQSIVWMPALSALTEDYIENRNDLYYRLDGHLNDNGNLVLGRYTADRVAEELLSH